MRRMNSRENKLRITYNPLKEIPQDHSLSDGPRPVLKTDSKP